MAGKPKYAVDQVADLLIQNFGNKSAVAQVLGADWHTIDSYCKKYATCRKALETARNRWVDMAENKLAQKVSAGDNWAIGKVLNELGRDRGWGKPAVGTRDEPLAIEVGVTDPKEALAKRLHDIRSGSTANGEAGRVH